MMLLIRTVLISCALWDFTSSRLIKAFEKAHKEYENIKLIMVGDGNALTEIKVLARSLRIENNIIFTGRIPQDKVVNYIGMADIGISYNQ